MHYIRALAVNGRTCSRFDATGTPLNRQRALVRFLKSLPKPCAAFAANDMTAAEAIAASNLAGLSVPDEIAVLGVDNFEQICEHTAPPRINAHVVTGGSARTAGP